MQRPARRRRRPKIPVRFTALLSFASLTPSLRPLAYTDVLANRKRYTFTNEQGGAQDKEAILNDEDKVWSEVRHMHMKDALDKLIADFKAYVGEHGGTFGGEG